MTASSVELEQLKRQLIKRYEEQINEQLGCRAAAAAGDDPAPAPSSTPAYLYQQLLCLRAGRAYGVGMPTNASERVQLLAESQPPPEAMIMRRLRKAQDESIRLLAARTAATAGKSAEYDAAVAPSVDNATAAGGAREEVAAKPFTAEERMKLLSQIAAGSAPPPLSESAPSKLAPAAATSADDVAACDECAAEACENQSESENKEEEREAVEEREEAPSELAA
ncbi:hypothetical protein LDHU3_23.0740:CDS1 [Leishmania donovani]|uniref:Hypothetical_protein n=2 Tax=Leishmania donovani species complex TaxID=38574 RepID=A0A6L0XPQ2_LEIIN|nr:hypothetical protein LdCL_230010700 [Leishmania donovani]CAC9489237.1 hypothetical_protein [Leishmania infantum]CAJ1988927.1 hypothetical protein LDHU3_23.0740:CDS1 [Leishmania donovani]SUZ41925.1 hypothetical_protein [Leishmania infantum]VDZ44804.1 hypothetical_protein [Leishmania donovani]